MLTLQKTHTKADISVSTAGCNIDNLLSRQWLLTNGRGGYSASTIGAVNTSSYHGLLVGSLNPPANRIIALANCLEMIISKGQVFNLSTFEFADKFAPDGYKFIKRFRKDVGVHFDYETPAASLTKSVYLPGGRDVAAVVYDFTKVRRGVEFVCRPFIGLRNFHGLQKSYAPLIAGRRGDSLLIRHDVPGSCELFLTCRSGEFYNDPQWWFNFVYRTEKERGQDYTEDLWTPGFFKFSIETPARIVLWAQLTDGTGLPEELSNVGGAASDAVDSAVEDLIIYREGLLQRLYNTKRSDRYSFAGFPQKARTLLDVLAAAAEQFVVKGGPIDGIRTTILAGYPWFADWGRDALISLPGLLLLTGRLQEAKSVLTSFAASAEDGMIACRFDDYENIAYFNSVDTSLWFIYAAFQLLQASDDLQGFQSAFEPVIRRIIDAYRKGAQFNIRADVDGLITAGSYDTQLTWMDAKYDGIAFTPRYGKAVEINALWFNCLRLLGRFYTGLDQESAKHYEAMADQAGAAFCKLFWNETKGFLNDCILPDGTVDDSLRPNQIYAVSLEFSPLTARQQEAVVKTVQQQLLTPYGLRTLNQTDPNYKGIYTGPQQQRDGAYHQGTVWPYLIGPFVEGFLKVNQFSQASKKQAAEFIAPLLKHFTDDGCIGSLCEIFDGDNPGTPKGCFAQAWSVAELIRAYHLVNSR
jgi:predicted glycogen debranching enzyme